MKKIEITKERMNELLDLEKRMRLLEGAGIDNWEGYDIAMEAYNEEQELIGNIHDLALNILEETCNMVDTDVAGPGTGNGYYSEAEDTVVEIITKWLKENTKLFE